MPRTSREDRRHRKHLSLPLAMIEDLEEAENQSAEVERALREYWDRHGKPAERRAEP